MKKFLLFLAAIFAITASAQVKQKANFVNSVEEVSITNERPVVNTVTPLVKRARKAPAKKVGAARNIEGTYLLVTTNNYGSKHSNYNNKLCIAYQISITADGEGGYVVAGIMKNFTGEDSPVKATFADGVLSILPGQVMSTHASYGNIVLATPEDYSVSPIEYKPITFQLDEDGNFQQTYGQGIIRGIPEYSTGAYTLTPSHTASCSLMKANARLEAFDYDDNVDASCDICVEEIPEMNGGIIYGIEGGYVAYVIDADGNVQLGQQPIAYSTTYGQGSQYGFGAGVLTDIVYDEEDAKWYCYTSTATASGLAPVFGTAAVDGNNVTISLDPYSVFAYSASYGALRFAGYLADANDKANGPTIKFTRPSWSTTDLFMVGDATPLGWKNGPGASQSTMFTQVKPNIYKWTGKLFVGGEGFKVADNIDDWGAWHPSTDYAGKLDQEADVMRNGNPDTKWQLSEEGYYTVTINWETKEIKAEKYTPDFLPNEDGVYEIGTAEEFAKFALYVSHAIAPQDAKAVLTADIDLSAYKKVEEIAVGRSYNYPYKGTFDGQGHTIKIAIEDTKLERSGLFAELNGATIKNLTIEGSMASTDKNCIGGLGGRTRENDVTIENIIVKTAITYTGSNGDATAGGFFANMENNAVVKNCAFLGSINTGSSEGNGLITGWAGGGNNIKIQHCYVAPVSYTKNGNSADFARNNPSVVDCHVLSAADSALITGELCYTLNEGQEATAWYQTLGEDAYPVPFASHKVVYKNGDSYTNEEPKWDGTVTTSLDSVAVKSIADFEGMTLTFNNAKSLDVLEEGGGLLITNEIGSAVYAVWNPGYNAYAEDMLPGVNCTYELEGNTITLHGWYSTSTEAMPMVEIPAGTTKLYIVDNGTFIIDGDDEAYIEPYIEVAAEFAAPAEPFAIAVTNNGVEGDATKAVEASEDGVLYYFEVFADVEGLAAGSALPTVSRMEDGKEYTEAEVDVLDGVGEISFYDFGGWFLTEPGTYVLNIPEGTFVDENGTPSAAATFQWVIIQPEEEDPEAVEFVCTDGQAFGENEGSDKAFDGNIETKWCKNVGDDSFALISASKPVHVWGYELTTANDNEQYGRLIRGMKLYATNDSTVAANASSEEWIEIASEGPEVDMQYKKNYYTNRYYTNAEAPKTAYQYFKLQLTDGGFIQFSEFNFLYNVEETPVRYKWIEGSAENSAKVTDLDVTTKWEGSLAGNWFIVEAEDGEAHEIKNYAISTHDDGSWGDRAPKHWTIEASNDKENWETIAEVDNDPIQNVSYTTYEFNVNTTEKYRYIKMNLIEMKGNGWQQMGEFYVNATKKQPVVDFVLEEAVIDTITDSSWGSNDVYYTATFKFQKPKGAKYAYAEGLQLEGDNMPFQAGMYGMVELEDGDEVTIVYKDPMLADTDDESYEGDFRTPGTYKASATIMFLDADQMEIKNDEGGVLTATFDGEITLPVVREEEPEIPTYYLTGGGELLGNWNAGSRIEMEKGEVSLTLPRGTYEFKVWPTNEGWDGELGYSSVNKELSSANIMGTSGNNIRISVPYEQTVNVKVLADTTVVVTGVFVDYAVADVYTVVGDQSLVGSNWDLNDANNEMTLEGDSAVLVKTNVDIKKGSYKWKVVGDHSWSVQFPTDGDFFVEIPEDGVYNITFKLNVATGEGSYELDVVTGINSINALENATIYTLDGKKVEKINGAGLYIINGVKVSVK